MQADAAVNINITQVPAVVFPSAQFRRIEASTFHWHVFRIMDKRPGIQKIYLCVVC